MTVVHHFLLLTMVLSIVTFTTTTAREEEECSQLYPNAIRGPPVVKGKRFFDSLSGKYIPVKGIAYYPRPNAGDLAESDSVDYYAEQYRYIWEPDIINFQTLGINTIRIYAVDPTVDHSSFMCALQQAGIYVIVGLLADCKDCGIGASITDLDVCYPAALKTRGQYIIQVFSKYPNVLAFSAGNEVSLFAQDKLVEANAPCQKQFIRDMRAYIRDCSIRDIPVGVVAADPSAQERQENAKYYNCRSDPNDALENAQWFGLNAYQHCDGSATSIDEMDGYIQLLSDFESYEMSIPTLISEFGCRSRSFPAIDGFQSQRTWLQVDAIYSPAYVEVFAGGLVFEYSAEKKIADTSDGKENSWPYRNHTKLQYGVTYYAPIDCDHTDIRCRNVKYPEFDLLGAKFAEVQVDAPSLDKYNPPDIPVPECPASIVPLSDFDWPSAKEQDFWCPPDDELYVCSCAVTLAPTPSPNLGPIMAPKPEGWVPTEPIFLETSLSSREQLSMTLTLLLLLLLVNMDL
jgi:hypothetical protein